MAVAVYGVLNFMLFYIARGIELQGPVMSCPSSELCIVLVHVDRVRQCL
jgi:hypothetical protein